MAQPRLQPNLIGTVHCGNKVEQPVHLVRFLRDTDGSPLIQLEDEAGGAEVRPTLAQLQTIVTHATRLYRTCVMATAVAMAGKAGLCCTVCGGPKDEHHHSPAGDGSACSPAACANGTAHHEFETVSTTEGEL